MSHNTDVFLRQTILSQSRKTARILGLACLPQDHPSSLNTQLLFSLLPGAPVRLCCQCDDRKQCRKAAALPALVSHQLAGALSVVRHWTLGGKQTFSVWMVPRWSYPDSSSSCLRPHEDSVLRAVNNL